MKPARIQSSARRETRVGLTQMLVGTFLISFSAVFVKIAHIGPTMAGFYRMLFGAIVLLAIVLVKREVLWKGRVPLALAVIAGVFFAADLISWHRSINYVGPGLSTILANFQVFFLAAIGVLVFGERMTWQFAVSIPLALVGLFFLVGVEWESFGARYRIGVGLGLFCAVMYTCYLLVLRRSQLLENRLLPTANLTIITVVTAVMLAPVGWVQGESFAIVDGQTALALVAYGSLCQAVGWILISRAVTRIEASRIGLLLLLQPTLTFIWDMLFFARPTTSIEILGALLTLVAIYFGSKRR